MRVLLLFVAACGMPPPSFGPDAGECTPFELPAQTDLTAPTVSFKTDVMPVLTNNCSSASCHGIADGAAGGLFLGDETKHGSDSAMVYASLVATAGQIAMPYVTANDPAKSYVMHKLDDDQCMLDAMCSNGTCSHLMPFDGQLPIETRNIVRRWIAQGAANN